MLDDFWAGIDAQCAELRQAHTADEVIDILNRYGPASSGDAFFAGSGGDTQVYDCLNAAGWDTVWYGALYYWVMEAPDGSHLTYVEGDVYRGDLVDR